MSFRDKLRKFKSDTKSRILQTSGAKEIIAQDQPLETPTIAVLPDPPPESVSYGWTHLKTFLEVLEQAAKPLAPLRAAMVDLAQCIYAYEDIARERKEYGMMCKELEELFQELCHHCGQDIPPSVTATVENLCRFIREEVGEIHGKVGRRNKSAYLKAQDDIDTIFTCYCRVQGYLQRISLLNGVAMKLNTNISAWRIVNELATNDRLKNLSPSLSACYNSAQAVELKRGPCGEGTRVELLAQMLTWLDHSSPGSVYWMNGMAGTGKTTIAYSLCQELDTVFSLAASFFCSRLLPECRDINRIIPSIAYQLARSSHPFRAVLSSLLEKDPDVHTRLPHLQFDALIVRPLLEAKDTLPDNLVVVIDALDECENKESTSRILDVLLTRSAGLPVRFVVSSRPEPEIRDEMTKQSDQAKSRVILHELDKQSVQADIETYLRATLAPMEPTEDQIVSLVRRAGILFIYAATAVRYIGYDKFRRNPRVRLTSVLNSSSTAGNKHKEIDELYTTILEGALNNQELDLTDIGDMRQILYTVVCAREPLTVNALSRLLSMNDTDRVHAALRPLWSVLHVSGPSELVTTLHASFPDYMFDPLRSNSYHCDSRVHNQMLALCCFGCLKAKHPQFNVCGLESSYISDDSVEQLEERIQNAVSTELYYAARYWAVHLHSATGSPNLMQELEEFMSVRLLLWMEVMSLKKCPGAMPEAIRLVEKWDSECSPDLKALVHDAWRFTTTFALGAVSKSTPHIYTSLLPFWPKSNPISRSYIGWTQGMMKIEGTAIAQRQHALLATWYFDGVSASATFSPDGSQIAVGVGFDIQLLSASTGQKVLPPFHGHRSLVHSLGFSPDGSRIVSGSMDHSVRIWSTETGETVFGPLEGHTDWVYSVTFSPDGSRIVSASRDKTIRMWDARTGELVLEPLTTLSEWIYKVKYSPNEPFMITADGSQFLTVWDTEDGRIIKTIGQHDSIGGFVSADISPDGTRVACGTTTNGIYIWDIETGQLMLGPLAVTATSSPLAPVAFSPNGAWVALGSQNGMLSMWDARSGDLVLGPLEGHTNQITSVCFSPDSAYIISCSNDKTLRSWDAQMIQAKPNPLPGHTASVTSAGFSPEGPLIISGSEDQTVCAWNIESGEIHLGPFTKDMDREVLVTFSPDGTHILFTDEGGIMILDAQSGNITLGPLHRYWSTTSAGFSSDGAYLACSSMKNIVQILSVDTGQTLMIIHPPPITGKYDWVTSVTLSPDKAHIAVGSNNNSLSMYETYSGKLLWGPLDGHNNNFRSVGFSPDGSRIVSGSTLELLVRDVYSGETVLGPLKGHVGWVNSIEFSPDGTQIVSGATDNAICIWDAQTGHPVLGPVKWHTAPVLSVRFSPDSTRVVSGSQDKTIRITNIGTKVRNLSDSSATISDWRMNEDGWIVGEEDRLLAWVPPDLRAALMWPRTDLLISKKGYVRLDFTHAYLGGAWTGCYRVGRHRNSEFDPTSL